MKYFILALKKYAVFEGRATRKEYWYFVLFQIIINLSSSFLFGAFFGIIGNYPYIGMIFSYALLIPGIAVAVRRMHDVGKSGWFVLIPFYNLILACTESEKETNEYGPNPYGEESFEFEKQN
jgi:uncharacterized membrane protein YhaH (DUF805 family)